MGANSKSLIKNSGIASLHIPICFFGALIGNWASNSHFLSLCHLFEFVMGVF
jgi:hypothetical protein